MNYAPLLERIQAKRADCYAGDQYGIDTRVPDDVIVNILRAAEVAPWDPEDALPWNPDNALAEMRTLIAESTNTLSTTANRIAVLADSIDRWIRGGGHLPSQWESR